MAWRKGQNQSGKIVNYQTWVGVVVSLLVGVGLLYVGGHDAWWKHHHPWQIVINGLAGFFVVSFGLGTIWQLVGKRAFAREILETASAITNFEAAGITRIGTNYTELPDWGALFADATKVDIFVAYGRTWRNTNLTHLRAFAARPNTKLRVFLPDPDDDFTMERLSRRFEYTTVVLQEAIREARHAYWDLQPGSDSVVEVYSRAGASLFSAYRFDKTAVVTLYSHQQQRVPSVPTIVCRDGGFMYQFVREELASIERQSTLVPHP